MSTESSREQRESERIEVDYPVEFRVPGTEQVGTGRIRDLSMTGVRFETEIELQPGVTLSIKIPPLHPGAPKLLTGASVIRCIRAAGYPAFAVGCVFD